MATGAPERKKYEEAIIISTIVPCEWVYPIFSSGLKVFWDLMNVFFWIIVGENPLYERGSREQNSCPPCPPRPVFPAWFFYPPFREAQPVDFGGSGAQASRTG